MITALHLPPALRAQLETEARASLPYECCGLIEGVEKGGDMHAISLHPTTNLSSERDRFEIDPAIHFALMRRLRGGPHRVTGCYHSHPGGPAEPSARDHESPGEDGFIWLVAAITDRTCELRAFAREEGGFRALALA